MAKVSQTRTGNIHNQKAGIPPTKDCNPQQDIPNRTPHLMGTSKVPYILLAAAVVGVYLFLRR